MTTEPSQNPAVRLAELRDAAADVLAAGSTPERLARLRCAISVVYRDETLCPPLSMTSTCADGGCPTCLYCGQVLGAKKERARILRVIAISPTDLSTRAWLKRCIEDAEDSDNHVVIKPKSHEHAVSCLQPGPWCEGQGTCITTAASASSSSIECMGCQTSFRSSAAYDAHECPAHHAVAARGGDDWTRSSDGRSNSSALFLHLVERIGKMIRGMRIDDNVESKARLIVAQLAHVHGLVPRFVQPTDGTEARSAMSAGDQAMLEKLRWLRDTCGVDIELMFARAQQLKARPPVEGDS